MTISKEIVNIKAKIKQLCQQYLDTPTTHSDSELLLGVIGVYKIKLSELRRINRKITAQEKKPKSNIILEVVDFA